MFKQVVSMTSLGFRNSLEALFLHGINNLKVTTLDNHYGK